MSKTLPWMSTPERGAVSPPHSPPTGEQVPHRRKHQRRGPAKQLHSTHPGPNKGPEGDPKNKSNIGGEDRLYSPNTPGSKPQGVKQQKPKATDSPLSLFTHKDSIPSSQVRAQLNKYAYQPKQLTAGPCSDPSLQLQHSPPNKPVPTTSEGYGGLPNVAPTSKEKISPLLLYPELKLLLQSIPTKEDLARTETNIRSDIRNIQEQVDAVSSRVSVIETHNDVTDSRLAEVIEAQSALRQELQEHRSQHQSQILLLQEHLDDLENRHRRNNLRIRGLPESVGRADLRSTVVNIFNSILRQEQPREIMIDRVYRSLGPPAIDPARPRDIICRVHYYTLKEEILRKAWENGQTEWEGSQIQIFPDVSKRTLQMRRSLKPLLARIKELGATYRWGFPFQLIIRKNGSTFLLRTHEQLGDLFDFLETDPLPIPNWQDQGALVPPRADPRRGEPLPQRARRQRPRERPNRDGAH